MFLIFGAEGPIFQTFLEDFISTKDMLTFLRSR